MLLLYVISRLTCCLPSIFRNRKDVFDKYCARQAELGVGDCGGLRLIPGMTKSGVQVRPEWMNKLFGMEEQ